MFLLTACLPAVHRPARLWLCAGLLALFACTPQTPPQTDGPNKPGQPGKQSTLPATVQIQVARFIDGDSFVARRDNGDSVPVRISGIDAPEKDQPGGRAATNALRRLVQDHWLVLRVVKRDRYGRLVGRLMDKDRDIGLLLVRKGLAWHFTRYEHEQAPAVRRQYRQAQRTARENGLGIWVDPAPVSPWDWRRQRRSRRR